MPPFVCISCIHTLIIAICPARVKRKSPKRRLRRIKRGDFEEVPRLSAASAGESRPARRCADTGPAAQEAPYWWAYAPTGPLIPKPVKKLEKLFIAPKVRQVLYETSQRVFTRCVCARRKGFLIKFFNQESVSVTFGDCSPRGRAKSGTPAKKGRGTWRFRAPWGALSLNIPGPSAPAGSGARRLPRRAPSAAEATGPAGRWSPD